MIFAPGNKKYISKHSRWDDALEVLDAIIEEDEANSSARKRKIAIFKAQGDRSRTVAELNKYLKIFMSDQVSSEAKVGSRIQLR